MKILLMMFMFVMVHGSIKECNRKDCCNKEQAKHIADRLMKKAGGDLNGLDVTIQEGCLSFMVKYSLRDTMSLGGGGYFRVSKEDCRVIDEKLYQ